MELSKNYALRKYILKVNHILFALFILCIPFQDFGLQDTFLRVFGKNLSNIPLILLIVLSFINSLLGEKISKRDFMIFFGIIIYMVIYSLLVITNHINDDNIISYVYKIVSNSIIFIFWLYIYIYTKNHTKKIGKYIIIANIIHIVGWIICDILKINLGNMIHYLSDADYNRFHGFTSEASLFCFTSVILGFLSIYYTKNKIIRIIFGILILLFIIFGGSKGTLVCILISLLLYIILNKNYKIKTKFIFFSGIIIISFLGIYYILLNSFLLDLEESTSFASRFSSILSVSYILYDYPLGTGFGLFLPVFKIFIVKAFDLLNSYIPGIVLICEEIDNWISNENGENAVIKSIIFQYIAYFGIPFLIGFLYYIKYMIKNILYDEKFLWLFIFIICGLLTFASFNYDSIIALAIIFTKIKERQMR